MPEPTPYPAVDALAAAARATLAADPEQRAEVAQEPATGTAADGQVHAVAGPDGRLRELSIDPGLLRQPLADVAAAARSAVNEALGAASSEPDYAPVVELIRDVQSQVRRDLGRVTSALSEVTTHVRAANGNVANVRATYGSATYGRAD